ncbi:hypothetical protein Plhal703r1_c29g0115801 [Plasmopara halstedii]
MIKLKCAIVGAARSVFEVKIDDAESVSALKGVIKKKKIDTIKCEADKLELYLAKIKDGGWLTDDDALDAMLQSGIDVTSYLKMRSSWKLNKPNLFGPNNSREEDVVHVLVVVPEGKASETSKIDQLIEKVDKLYEQTVLGKRKVYRHSSPGSTLLTELNIRLQATDAVEFASGDVTHVEPFTWDCNSDERGQDIALTEEQQRERYRAYMEANIGDVLKRNRLCVYRVVKGKDILKAEIPGHNIKLVGRTDMIILSDLVLKNPLDLGMLPNVRLLIEVKRKVTECAMSQALSELIALDVLVDEPVMAF